MEFWSWHRWVPEAEGQKPSEFSGFPSPLPSLLLPLALLHPHPSLTLVRGTELGLCAGRGLRKAEAGLGWGLVDLGPRRAGVCTFSG